MVLLECRQSACAVLQINQKENMLLSPGQAAAFCYVSLVLLSQSKYLRVPA